MHQQQIVTSESRTWALLSYGAVFAGIPLFLLPIIQRDNAFSLYHAKQAAVSFGMFFVLGILFSVFVTATCGFGIFALPLVFLPYITLIHGMMLANNGELKEPVGNFGLANTFLSGIVAQEKGAQPAPQAPQSPPANSGYGVSHYGTGLGGEASAVAPEVVATQKNGDEQ